VIERLALLPFFLFFPLSFQGGKEAVSVSNPLNQGGRKCGQTFPPSSLSRHPRELKRGIAWPRRGPFFLPRRNLEMGKSSLLFVVERRIIA